MRIKFEMLLTFGGPGDYILNLCNLCRYATQNSHRKGFIEGGCPAQTINPTPKFPGCLEMLSGRTPWRPI